MFELWQNKTSNIRVYYLLSAAIKQYGNLCFKNHFFSVSVTISDGAFMLEIITPKSGREKAIKMVRFIKRLT